MDFFSTSPETIAKRMVLTNKEDFDEVLAEIKKAEQAVNEKNGGRPWSEILEVRESNFQIVMRETFKDSICPRCHCRTIGNVLVEDQKTRKSTFVDECNGCNLRFIIFIESRD